MQCICSVLCFKIVINLYTARQKDTVRHRVCEQTNPSLLQAQQKHTHRKETFKRIKRLFFTASMKINGGVRFFCCNVFHHRRLHRTTCVCACVDCFARCHATVPHAMPCSVDRWNLDATVNGSASKKEGFYCVKKEREVKQKLFNLFV